MVIVSCLGVVPSRLGLATRVGEVGLGTLVLTPVLVLLLTRFTVSMETPHQDRQLDTMTDE